MAVNGQKQKPGTSKRGIVFLLFGVSLADIEIRKVDIPDIVILY